MSGFTKELRHGWRNLLAASIGLGFGVVNYTSISSLFFRALETEFGWSKTAAAGALVALPITALILPIAGWLIDRRGVRLMAGGSILGGALCFFLLSRIDGGLLQYYAVFIALYIVGCCTGPISYTRLVAADFHSGRGTALAVAQFGTAFLAMMLPLAAGWIIQHYGWRAGYGALVVSTLIGGGVALALMRPGKRRGIDPKSMGFRPREALRSTGFWMLGASLLFGSMAVMGLVAQLQSVVIERGVAPQIAPRYLAALALSAMISRLVVGRLLDLRRPALWSAGVLCVAALGMLMLAMGPNGSTMTILFVMMIGCGLGAELDLLAFFCVRLFGMRHYSSVYGMLSAFYYCGTAIGGLGYGFLYDRLGSYQAPLTTAGILLFASAALFLLLPDRPHPSGVSPRTS